MDAYVARAGSHGSRSTRSARSGSTPGSSWPRSTRARLPSSRWCRWNLVRRLTVPSCEEATMRQRPPQPRAASVGVMLCERCTGARWRRSVSRV
eukprot:7379761-Prymnesium_polylepis.2